MNYSFDDQIVQMLDMCDGITEDQALNYLTQTNGDVNVSIPRLWKKNYYVIITINNNNQKAAIGLHYGLPQAQAVRP